MQRLNLCVNWETNQKRTRGNWFNSPIKRNAPIVPFKVWRRRHKYIGILVWHSHFAVVLRAKLHASHLMWRLLEHCCHHIARVPMQSNENRHFSNINSVQLWSGALWNQPHNEIWFLRRRARRSVWPLCVKKKTRKIECSNSHLARNSIAIHRFFHSTAQQYSNRYSFSKRNFFPPLDFSGRMTCHCVYLPCYCKCCGTIASSSLAATVGNCNLFIYVCLYFGFFSLSLDCLIFFLVYSQMMAFYFTLFCINSLNMLK